MTPDYACSLLAWSDFPPGLGADDTSTRTNETVTKSVYPTACEWETWAADEEGHPAVIKVVVGFLPGSTKDRTTLPAGAHWDTFIGHDRTVKQATMGTGEPTCQTGLFLPELSGRVDMLVINAGTPLMNVCTLADALNATIVGRVT